MIFNTHILNAPLDKYITSIFHFKNFTPDHSIERVIPTGQLFIIFELDGFVRNTFDNDSLKPNNTFTQVWVSGMQKNYISISAHQNSEMFVIQFNAFGAYPFFHFPIQELNDKVIPAEQLFGEDILKLRTLILNAPDSAAKFLLAENWLTKRFKKELTPPEELLTVIEKMHDTNSKLAFQSYTKTQKHLIDQFKKYVGLTPKYYQRILRFNEILQLIHKKEKIQWSQIAYQCGYADQAHFIKEFKQFSGFNPREFIKEDYQNDEPNFFPLDREG